MRLSFLHTFLLSTTMLAGALTSAQAAVVCANGTGGDITLDVTTRCLDNTANAGTVTITSGASANAPWYGYSTIVGSDSAGRAASITSIIIPTGTSLTTGVNGQYLILNGEYNSTSTSSNRSTIGSITNDGSVSMLAFLYNDHHGIVGTLTNNGSISGLIYNASGRIDSVVNAGAISGQFINLSPAASIGAISNAATGSMAASLANGGTIDSFTNAGVVTGAISNTGTLTTLTNSGQMASLTNSKTLGSFTNSGTFTGNITNSGSAATITDFVNSGTLKSLTNSGTITTLTNSGAFTGTLTNTGTITTLVNHQGGAGLNYSGKLPTNYVMHISSTGYGVTNFSSPSGTMAFSIDPASTLTPGTRYQNVLSGTTSSMFTGVTTGSFGSFGWTLAPDDGGSANVWDLLYGPTGPDAVNTRLALQANANALRGVMGRRLTSLALMGDYDCATFDAHGFCLSFQARYTGSEANSEGAGVLTGAWRLTDQVRLGAFIDYRVSEKDPAGLKFSNDMPTFGAFLGYSAHRDGTGLQAKALAAINKGSVTVSRSDELANTEPGAGKTSLNSYALAGELGWGFALSQSMLLTPYVGVRYTEAARGAYTESTSEDVEYPVSYDRFHNRLTTAKAGLRLAGALTDTVGYHIGAGVEHDLRQQVGKYSGASTIPDLETFALATQGVNNRTRGFGSAGLHYQLDRNQRLTSSVSLRQTSFSHNPVATVLVGFQSAF